MTRGMLGIIVISFTSVGTTASAIDNVACETSKLLAADADALDRFADQICVRGDLAISGAWNDEETVLPVSGFTFGSAYIFRRTGDTWAEEQKLLPSNPQSELRFGHDVAIDGNAAMVSAPGADGYTGAVYFYTHDGNAWTGEQIVQPRDALPADQFGNAIALDGAIAIAGMPRDSTVASSNGAAYMMRNVGGTWAIEQKIIPADAAQFDYFGSAVALRGNMAFIACRVDDDLGVSTGSVYIYQETGGSWSLLQKIYAPDAVYGELFGHAVAVDGDLAVVSALHDDDACPDDDLCNSGSAYIFRFDGERWNYEAKITAPDGAADDEFGESVAIEGGTVVVGAQHNDDGCVDDPECQSGSGYIFHESGGHWSYAGKLLPSDTEWRDYAGSDVDISGGDAFLSCHGDDDGGSGSGSIYLFDAINVGCPCPADLNQDSVVDFNDVLIVLTAWDSMGGLADVNNDGVVNFGDLLAMLTSWGPCQADFE